MSYGLTVDLLKEVLPIHECLDAETVRRHLHKTAQRQDETIKDQSRFISGCQNDWSKLQKPGKPLTVGIDGGYGRDCDNKRSNFEVIVAKSFSKTKVPKRLGFVQTLDDKPQRRLMKLLRDRGNAGKSTDHFFVGRCGQRTRPTIFDAPGSRAPIGLVSCCDETDCTKTVCQRCPPY